MTSLYKSVLFEIRPRLQCVNAFITLSTGHQTIEVTLDDEIVILTIGTEVAKIPCRGIKIISNSVTCLKVTDKFLTFRFLTESAEEIGSFKTELLHNTVANEESLNNKPLLSNGVTYVLQCINCNRSLSDPIEYTRILPLPSENSDASDWFCHNHGEKTNISLDPKPSDIFYSQCFVHMNAKCVSNIKSCKQVFVCRFCLQWLGTKHNNNTIKIWFNTIKFTHYSGSISSCSLEDAFQTIKNSLRYSIHNASKILLSCHTSSTQTGTIMLWVLEKKLQILFGETNVKEYNVAKVLFKFVSKDEHLLQQWENDSLVTSVDISKPMMVELLTNLHKCNKLFPLEYSKSNGFNVSYAFLYDIF
ncbi:E3 ubiquitin-protein ligase E3D [Diabrotica undecimpunctata]|uniref:E3 ubiquitin-protein ligase E3D n=1 Tax=Diabrotica undecimpunctata TaxID=50387 RepID=UPI003B6398FE